MGRALKRVVMDIYIRRFEYINMKTDIQDVAFSDMETKAEKAAQLLATLANAKRLRALCHPVQGRSRSASSPR
jgi:hypothetical protein